MAQNFFVKREGRKTLIEGTINIEGLLCEKGGAENLEGTINCSKLPQIKRLQLKLKITTKLLPKHVEK